MSDAKEDNKFRIKKTRPEPKQNQPALPPSQNDSQAEEERKRLEAAAALQAEKDMKASLPSMKKEKTRFFGDTTVNSDNTGNRNMPSKKSQNPLEKVVEDVDDEIKLVLQPLKIDISRYVEFATEYEQKLTDEQKNSFDDIMTTLKKMEDGYERHYIKLVSYAGGRKLAHGLACINVDQTF